MLHTYLKDGMAEGGCGQCGCSEERCKGPHDAQNAIRQRELFGAAQAALRWLFIPVE